nr:hypothetical protein [Anaerolineae bacterium]
LRDQPRMATVRVLDDKPLEVVAISREIFMQMAENSSETSSELALRMMVRLSQAASTTQQ